MAFVRNDMTPSEALDILLPSFHRYYTIQTEQVEPPFAAEAVFHSHDEQYFLLKSAKLAEAESHEYVFFALGEDVELEEMRRLEQCAWERGVARAKPSGHHRSTDVTFILLARHISDSAKDHLRHVKRYQSYRCTLHGWSHFKAVALELSTGTLSCNRQGRDLSGLFRNIQNSLHEEEN